MPAGTILSTIMRYSRSVDWYMRLVFMVLVASRLTWLAYNSKYHASAFNALESGILMFAGGIVWGWSVYREVQHFGRHRRIGVFTITLLGMVFLLFRWALERHSQADFEKPTLLSAYHNDGSNGSGFDFKTDGTYIFSSFVLSVNYCYGTYKMDGDRITLDKNILGHFSNMKHLEIRKDALPPNESCLFKVDRKGNTFAGIPKYTITTDNRKK